MFFVGDIVLADVFVGVVVKANSEQLICNCSDGKQHKFSIGDVTLITSYKDMLNSFRRSILTNVSG